MHAVLTVSAIALALSSCAPRPEIMLAETPAPGRMNNGLPPVRYQDNGAAIVIFTDRAGIDSMCGVAEPPHQIIACKRSLENGVPVIIMPNACYVGQVEYYARIMCHEMGHVNGWGVDHEE